MRQGFAILFGFDSAQSEDAGSLSGLFEYGECLIDLCDGMFGGDGHTDSAGLLGYGRRADGRGEEPVGQKLFGKTQGHIGLADENRYDRASAACQRKAGANESREKSVTVLPEPPAAFRLPSEYV